MSLHPSTLNPTINPIISTSSSNPLSLKIFGHCSKNSLFLFSSQTITFSSKRDLPHFFLLSTLITRINPIISTSLLNPLFPKCLDIAPRITFSNKHDLPHFSYLSTLILTINPIISISSSNPQSCKTFGHCILTFHRL